MASKLVGQGSDIHTDNEYGPRSRNEAPFGIALGGGAARGLSHIGVLKVLTARGLSFPVITGTSMGAIIGAAYACGKLAELEAVARSITPLSMSGWLDMNLRTGALKGDAVKELFGQFVGDTTFADLRERGISLSVVAADLDKEEPVYINDGRVDEAVRASMSIPGVFEPVDLDGRVLVDGGLMDNVPVDAARSLGAKIVVGVEVLNTYDIWHRAALGLGLSVVQLREIRMRLRQMADEHRSLRDVESGGRDIASGGRDVESGGRDEANASSEFSSGHRDETAGVAAVSVGRPNGAGQDEESARRVFNIPLLSRFKSSLSALFDEESRSGGASPHEGEDGRKTKGLRIQGRTDQSTSLRKIPAESHTSLRTSLDALDIIASILEDGRQPFRANSRADVFIRPDVRRYNAHQFYRAPQLIELGERAAREALPDIMALAAGQLVGRSQ